jgi:hypothetical protein
MPLAYVISAVAGFADEEAARRYAELAGPAIARFGGRFIVSNAEPLLAEGESLSTARTPSGGGTGACSGPRPGGWTGARAGKAFAQGSARRPRRVTVTGNHGHSQGCCRHRHISMLELAARLQLTLWPALPGRGHVTRSVPTAAAHSRSPGASGCRGSSCLAAQNIPFRRDPGGRPGRGSGGGADRGRQEAETRTCGPAILRSRRWLGRMHPGPGRRLAAADLAHVQPAVVGMGAGFVAAGDVGPAGAVTTGLACPSAVVITGPAALPVSQADQDSCQ